MTQDKTHSFIKKVITHFPSDWLTLTTHRLDIYNEAAAKTEFLEQFEALFAQDNAETVALSQLPTAYDYIRLGHPLSSVLEWTIAQKNSVKPSNVITFSSKVAPILAILRKNLLEKKATRIYFTEKLPESFDAEIIRRIYGYTFDCKQVTDISEVERNNDTTIFIHYNATIGEFNLNEDIDFHINLSENLGSILLVNGEKNEPYISEIQHVRRRETIAMTPANCFIALRKLIGEQEVESNDIAALPTNKQIVSNTVKQVTGTAIAPLVASSGLSMQYAIMMGLIHDAMNHHPGKAIRFMVPPNCYGGTNDQARRVAACLEHVEIVDLPVDGEYNMVQSIDAVLERVAQEDAVPYIIAEIPTNPRVEVPDLNELRAVLSKKRLTQSGDIAIDPVFILDQTFCPNVQFLGEDKMLSTVRTISYVSGSKFPSGGKCTAGYCVANQKAEGLMEKIEQHLQLCDNEATPLQMVYLAEQLPSMNQRIHDAYLNTRAFVNYIREVLPEAKINFVSEELAQQGFTPSVFSLDLPTKGTTHEEREAYKRALNLKLINLMINEIPAESKYCVSYGQLKGCYWTIPATSTQGTTKEGDKDYIVRVALSHNMDLELHKKVFLDFVRSI